MRVSMLAIHPPKSSLLIVAYLTTKYRVKRKPVLLARRAGPAERAT
jgi:hypothetical protein